MTGRGEGKTVTLQAKASERARRKDLRLTRAFEADALLNVLARKEIVTNRP